ncbi:hypothetical protein RclHR1_02320004 [Rhizophagus clarus]|nr:hypothetical protein RclHR1_02320004 [Rhizophagus clarus]
MAKQPSNSMYNNLDDSPFTVTPFPSYTTSCCEQQPISLNGYDNIMQSYSTNHESHINIDVNEQNLSQTYLQNHSQNIYDNLSQINHFETIKFEIPGYEVTIRPTNLNNNLGLHYTPAVMLAESFKDPQNNNTIINQSDHIPAQGVSNKDKKVKFILTYLPSIASINNDDDKRPIPRKAEKVIVSFDDDSAEGIKRLVEKAFPQLKYGDWGFFKCESPKSVSAEAGRRSKSHNLVPVDLPRTFNELKR